MYVSDANYRDQIRATTDKGIFDQKLQKQSEFKKPYRSDNFQEMEYFYPHPGDAVTPSLINPEGPVSVPDVPWMNETVPNAEEMPYGPWWVAFGCFGSGCYCPGQTKCFDMKCFWPVTNVVVHKGPGTVTGRNYICVTADSGATDDIELSITMIAPVTRKDGSPVFGATNMIITKCDDKDCCDCGVVGISYTTLGMQVNEEQSLSASPATSGEECYSWSTTMGSFNTSIGSAVTFTAPSSNSNCANAIITLNCGGSVVDTIEIAINADTAANIAYVVSSGDCAYGGICSGDCPPSDPVVCGTWSFPWYCGNWKNTYKCDGTVVLQGSTSAQPCALNTNPPNTGCAGKTSGCVNCGTYNGITAGCNGTTDVRSAAMKANGCCPEELI